MNLEKLNNELFVQGWSLVEGNLNDSELLSLAEKLGAIVPDNNGQIVQYLKPKDNREGIKDSFSFNFGYGVFPYHTDTAFWPLPARYILMKSERESICDTYLFDFKQILKECNNEEFLQMKKSVFVERTFSGRKFTSFIFHDKEIIGVRYDPNIMFTFNSCSKNAIYILNSFILKKNHIKIKWTGSNTLIVDNWRILHSRGDSSQDKNRLMKRIYIS